MPWEDNTHGGVRELRKLVGEGYEAQKRKKNQLIIKNKFIMSSRQLDDLYEEQADKHIADLLGITTEEYQQLVHDGIQDETSNDGLVYRQYIEFKDTSPKHILNIIAGLDANNTFYFEPGSFAD